MHYAILALATVRGGDPQLVQSQKLSVGWGFRADGTRLALSTPMRLGIATHQGRVSPVLDVTKHLWVVCLAGKSSTGDREVTLTARSLVGRVREIQAADIDVLICGALSWPLETALAAAGIDVVSRVCGQVEAVLEAYLAGRLDQGAFRMPGCSRRRRHRACGGEKHGSLGTETGEH